MTPYYHEYEDLQINNGIRNFPLFFQAWYTQKIGVKNQMKLRAASLRGII